MISQVPGMRPARMVALMRAAVARCKLDLAGLTILTEAASGAYVVTPVLAAMAGAERVIAVTRDSRYASFEEVRAQTELLAELAGVADRIEIVRQKTPEIVAAADVVTNSGHVRPLDAETIGWMKDGAVVPLMYEAWEFRDEDVDLAACRARGIRVAGTNERIPEVDVFSYLGVMAIKLLFDAGVSVYGSRLLLLCDNPFDEYIVRGLEGAGASVTLITSASDPAAQEEYDAWVVALLPEGGESVGASEAEFLTSTWPGTVVVQYWGDMDRPAFERVDLPVWPARDPGKGHMGVLPSAVGPESIVRLQSGGLKVAEILSRGDRGDASEGRFVQYL